MTPTELLTVVDFNLDILALLYNAIMSNYFLSMILISSFLIGIIILVITAVLKK